MTEIIEWVLIVYTASNFIFELLVVDNFSLYALTALILGVLNALLPMEQINIWIFPPRPDIDETTNYYDAD